jgi:predicted Ser/Thr protein kinase
VSNARCPDCQAPLEDAGHVCRPAEDADARAQGRKPDPLVGSTVLGRYAVGRRLGVGGFGTVYLARQAPVDRPVALKVLAADASADPELRQRFLNEARAICRLNSPYTVRLIDFGTLDDDRLFMVTEFIDGRTLDVAGRRGLDVGQVTRIAEQICQSLHEAHTNGIVHQDLKPQNVMLQRVADDWIVKVLDFGIAKLGEAGTLTAPSALLGTPQYMSPEQALGVAVDARADLYALGVVLYELLAGRPPFEGGSVASLLYRHAHEAPRPLSEVAPGAAPPALEAIVMRLLAKRPEDRFSSARELQTALVAGAAAVVPSGGESEVVPPLTPREPAPLTPPAASGLSTRVVDAPPSRRLGPALLVLAVAAAAGVALAFAFAGAREDEGPPVAAAVVRPLAPVSGLVGAAAPPVTAPETAAPASPVRAPAAPETAALVAPGTGAPAGSARPAAPRRPERKAAPPTAAPTSAPPTWNVKPGFE